MDLQIHRDWGLAEGKRAVGPLNGPVWDLFLFCLEVLFDGALTFFSPTCHAPGAQWCAQRLLSGSQSIRLVPSQIQ